MVEASATREDRRIGAILGFAVGVTRRGGGGRELRVGG